MDCVRSRRETSNGFPERNDGVLRIGRIATIQVPVLPTGRREIGPLIEVHTGVAGGEGRRSNSGSLIAGGLDRVRGNKGGRELDALSDRTVSLPADVLRIAPRLADAVVHADRDRGSCLPSRAR